MQVEARALPGRCSRDTNHASRPDTGSCDENNPCLAHVHAMQALRASRASTSSLDGVRIAPADAAPYNAAQSLQYHPLSGEAARAERWQQRSAPGCSPNAVTMHRCSRNRTGSAYTDTGIRRHTAHGGGLQAPEGTVSTVFSDIPVTKLS